MMNLIDIMSSPKEIITDESKEENITEKIKKKRELLLNYALNPNSTEDDFNKIIEEYGDDVPYTVREALELIQSNYSCYPMINNLVNNYSLFYNKTIGPYLLKYAKEHNPLNQPFIKTNNFVNNPYFKEGVSNKEFNVVWKMYRSKYITIKDSDKDLTAKLYSFEDLKILAGYVGDQKKINMTGEDKNDFGIPDTSTTPTTKGELYEYWRKLAGLHNNYADSVFGDIRTETTNDKLSDIRIIFVGLQPTQDDLNIRLYKYEDPNITSLIKQIGITTEQYMNINISNSVTSFALEKCWREIFDKLLNILSKSTIIVPIDDITYKVFGCTNTNEYYKYNMRIISPVLINKDVDEFTQLLNGKKVSVKRTNNFKTDYIISMINSHFTNNQTYETPSVINDIKTDINDLVIDNNLLKDLEISSDFHFSNQQYTYQEFNQELQSLKDYNITYCSKTINNSRRYGKDRNGKPYICLRKGKEKRFYYINPTIKVGYSYNSDAMAEEPLDRLHITNIWYNQIYKYKKDIENDILTNNVSPSFYNVDFIAPIYIMSEIKNRMHYQEGMNNPRVLVLDFETETEATKVKPDTATTKAKCRLCSLYDVNYKTFYTAVLKDPKYHKDVDLSNIKEHDGYIVNIYEFNDEKDLWKWLNQMLDYLDPDILTGWNIEQFDLTYGIVRSKTLGIPLRSKYGTFEFIKSGTRIAVDGIAILDYMQLYRVNKMSKMERYTLEYICQEELGKGKREKIIDDHDEMYFKYLKEYTLYNIEDVELIGDLESKKNFLKFEFELCNVCNISWDDIYAKTRLIDGLVYNYAWDNHQTLLKSGFNNKCNNIGKIMYEDIAKFHAQTGIDIICDGTISLSKYLDEHYDEFNKNDNINEYYYDEDGYNNFSEENDDEEDEKGYEGAIVLEPQEGLKEMVADLDASQMYPRLMIRSNIFKDTLCAVIAINNEDLAEKWLYNREAFPSEVLIKEHNKPENKMLLMSKKDFEEYLKDKIITPFGTIYWKPNVKRSIISKILFDLIANRTKYKNLLKKAIKEIDNLKKEGLADDDHQIAELKFLCDRYDNLQMAYKSLINSFYGVMGMMAYRLADVFSAATITASGRELTRMVSYYSSKYMDEMIKETKVDVDFENVPIDVKTLVGLEKIENRPNIIYGDTDSAFLWIDKVIKAIYGDKLDMDDKIKYAWDIIERVSQYINKWVIIDILRRKGIDTEDEDKDYNYEYKKELVMSRIMFIKDKKKHYAYRLVFREGVKTDEIAIKGMAAIKSDNFRFTRDFSYKIINYLLTEYDINKPEECNKYLIDLYGQVLEDANKLIDSGDITIGKPVSMTKDVDNYKTISAQVKGMLLYDLLFDHEFKPGNKGYHYYITAINWQKLNKDPNDIMNQFMDKFKKCKWFETFSKSIDKIKNKKDHNLNEYNDLFAIFFNSITIPTESEKLDVDIFTIDKPKLLSNSINRKIEDVMKIVGIKLPEIKIPKVERITVSRSRKKKNDNIPTTNILDELMFRF